MFEAKLANSGLLKKIVESIKDLVTDAPFDCSETAMSLQAMDSSHVALVSLKLEVKFIDFSTKLEIFSFRSASSTPTDVTGPSISDFRLPTCQRLSSVLTMMIPAC